MIENLIVGMTATLFAYYLGWGAFGMAMSYAVQQVKYRSRIKTSGGFNPGFFIKDNIWRFVLTLGAMILGVSFTTKFTGHEISEYEAFLAGFATDKVVDMLTNKKK